MDEETERMWEVNGREKDCEMLFPEHDTDNAVMILLPLLLAAMDI